METLKCLCEHRSVRNFSDRPIVAEVESAILEAAVRGSTTGNMQLYSIIRTRDPQMRERLHAIHFRQPMVLAAPLMLTFVADVRRFSRWCDSHDAEPGFDNFLTLQSAVIDAVIAAQNAAVAAEDQGLGICYVGTALYQAEALIELFQLPPLVFPVTALAIGYPAVETDLTDRLPMAAVVHDEYYHDADAATIRDWFAAKEALPSSQAFIADNRLANLAQVYTKVRYPQDRNVALSGKLLSTLRRQGFAIA